MAIIDAIGSVVLTLLVGLKFGLLAALVAGILLAGIWALIRISDGA